MATKPRSRSRVSGMIAGALGILLVVALALAAVVHYYPDITKAFAANISQPSADGGTTVGKSVGTADKDAKEELSKAEKDAIVKALTVTTTTADSVCVADEFGLVSFKNQIGALKAVPDPRKWTDALSTPFTAKTAEKISDELQQTICKDPLTGVSYLVFYATDVRDAILAKTGVDIVKLNPWLKPYSVASPEEINTMAAEFIPLLDKSKPTEKQLIAGREANQKWQQEASNVNALFDRFALVGIEARKSKVNYHLAAGGLVVKTLPAVERNPKQENLPALVFALTEKDQCGELLAIGANIGDKRPELFTAKECKPDVTTPGCKKDCTTDTPKCKTDCNPKCTKDCLTPKSGDKKDYVYPTNKPKVTSPGPADKEKPKVDTEKTGGGGVKDTPTKDKGDETGVQAPGTKKPTNKPTPPPVNEGGDN